MTKKILTMRFTKDIAIEYDDDRKSQEKTIKEYLKKNTLFTEDDLGDVWEDIKADESFVVKPIKYKPNELEYCDGVCPFDSRVTQVFGDPNETCWVMNAASIHIMISEACKYPKKYGFRIYCSSGHDHKDVYNSTDAYEHVDDAHKAAVKWYNENLDKIQKVIDNIRPKSYGTDEDDY